MIKSNFQVNQQSKAQKYEIYSNVNHRGVAGPCILEAFSAFDYQNGRISLQRESRDYVTV